MNKTVELVKLWGIYEEKHPEGSLEDFFRHHLAHQQRNVQGTLVGGAIPPVNDGLLLKIIGRISKLTMNYSNLALRGTGLNQIEEFGMLFTVRQEQNPKKTEIIYANLFELSSGTDMLNRLKERGFIEEYNDKEDKRSKRIQLTAEGEKVVDECKKKIIQNAAMMMADLTEDDKELCIQLLKQVEIKFSSLWPKHKAMEFGAIYDEIMQGRNEG